MTGPIVRVLAPAPGRDVSEVGAAVALGPPARGLQARPDRPGPDLGRV